MRANSSDAAWERARVTACVVTYNRMDLLARLLGALAGQTHVPDRLVVVDNASTDGTEEFLRERFEWPRGTLTYVRMPENGGGAGGFAKAMDVAMKESPPPKYLWLMDDDGFPDPKCLERLLAVGERTDFAALNALVWAEGDAETSEPHLAFQPPDEATREMLEAARNVGQYVSGYASFFNGTLLRTRAVERCGLPIAEFFIWGDEVEYGLRLKSMGYEAATVPSAAFFHPLSRQVVRQFTLFHWRCRIPSVSADREYYLIRNFAFIAAKYRGTLGWLKHVAKWVVFGQSKVSEVLRWSYEGLSMARAGPSGSIQSHRN